MSMPDWIRAHPREFLRLVHQNLRRFASMLFSRSMFLGVLVALVTLCWFHFAWSRQRTEREALLAISIGPAVAFVLFVVVERYIAAVVPLLLIWTGRGLELLGEWLVATTSNLLGTRQAEGEGEQAEREFRAGFRRVALGRAVLWGAPLLLVVVLFAATAPGVWAQASAGSFRQAHKSVGLWLQAHGASPDAVVMSRYPAIAFHAGTRWVPTPNAAYDEVMRYAERKGVRYFVVDERETAKMRPQLAFLVEAENVPGELRLVQAEQSEGERIVVYEIAGGSQ